MYDKKQYMKSWRLKNKEHIKEYQSNPETKERIKKWREVNKLLIAEKKKRYQLKNKEKTRVYQIRWRKENRDKLLKDKKIWYENNKESALKIQRDNYKNNRIRKIEYQKKYQSENPENHLKNNIKHLTRLSIPLKLPFSEYKYALLSWSKTVKKRDKICVVCGSDYKLNSHHILHKAIVPELSLNMNNGVLLCKKHHDEVHGRIIMC